MQAGWPARQALAPWDGTATGEGLSQRLAQKVRQQECMHASINGFDAFTQFFFSFVLRRSRSRFPSQLSCSAIGTH